MSVAGRLLPVAFFSLAACGPPEGVPDAAPAPDCALALALEARGLDGEFHPVGASGEAELVLGFQGFKFIFVRARLDRAPPVTTTTVQVAIGGGAPRSQRFIGLELTPDGNGVVSEPLQIFFNDDPLPQLVGATCALAMAVGDEACRAQAAGEVTLRYRAGCVQADDGGFVCEPDGG